MRRGWTAQGRTLPGEAPAVHTPLTPSEAEQLDAGDLEDGFDVERRLAPALARLADDGSGGFTLPDLADVLAEDRRAVSTAIAARVRDLLAADRPEPWLFSHQEIVTGGPVELGPFQVVPPVAPGQMVGLDGWSALAQGTGARARLWLDRPNDPARLIDVSVVILGGNESTQLAPWTVATGHSVWATLGPAGDGLAEIVVRGRRWAVPIVGGHAR